MDKLKALVEEVKGSVEAIETEIREADDSGKFVYARSKNIRKAAMEIAKAARELRAETLNTFKAGQKNKE